MDLSVIIPAFNEEASIAASISSALAQNPLEVIVVDGGSLDRTRELAMTLGAVVLQSPSRGRAVQMNLGARQAKGDTLLFLHADTILASNYLKSIEQVITSGNQWGFFEFALNDNGLCFRALEIGVKLRSRIFGFSYGDQAMFATREFFERLGGFDEKVTLEDLDFLLRARRICRPCLLKEQAVTSARRWKRHGFWTVTLQHQIRLIQFLLKFYWSVEK